MQYYVLTYTGGVGWQEKETKAESQVHSALKMTYYEAFSEARKALNSEEKTGSVDANSIVNTIANAIILFIFFLLKLT